MQKKTPQGNDMPNFTPEAELEKYGVWVKAEPQDIIEEPETEHSLLGAPDIEGTADDMGLSAPNLLSDSDFDLSPSSGDEGLSSPPKGESAEPSLDGDDFTIELDDFSLDSPASLDGDQKGEDDELELSEDFEELPTEAFTPETTHFELEEAEPAMDTSAESDEITELSLEDFGLSDEPEEPKPAKEASGGMSAVDLSEFGLSDEEDKPEGKDAGAGDFSSLDIDLEFDDTIPSPAGGAAEEESTFSLDEVEELGTGIDGLEAVDAPRADADMGVSMEDVTAEFSGKASAASLGFQAEPTARTAGSDSFIDDESDESEDGILPELELEEVSLDASVKPSRAFDDVGALERELSAPTPADSASRDLLKTIATELASIKSELVNLRGQLDVLKRGDAGAPKPETAQEADQGAGGFFDDEEDDTIALTGDELDNILNTADFTEESAQDSDREEPQAQADASSPELLLPEDGDYASAQHDLAEALPDDIMPVTEAPEDTSYLEEETPDEFSLDTSALTEGELVEPDLSGLDLEMEPGAKSKTDDAELEELIIEDSELEELVPEETEMDDLVLSIDAPEGQASSGDESLEVLEELEEDESGLEELEGDDELGADLHTEAVLDMEGTIKPATPVSVHPDELSMSLDDSLFVEPAERDIEMSSPPADIAMPVMGGFELESSLEETAPAEPVAEDVPDKLKHDVKSVLLYLDQLLASLPEEKIEEFASSQYYDTYKKLFDELGLI